VIEFWDAAALGFLIIIWPIILRPESVRWGMLPPDEKFVETREPRATSSRRPARDVAPPRGVPAGEAHKVGLVAAVGASGGRRCGGTCGVQALDAGFLTAAANDLRDTTPRQAAACRVRAPRSSHGGSGRGLGGSGRGLGGLVAEGQGAGAAALPHHVDDVEVDVLDADLGEFLQARAGVEEQVQDRGVASLVEAAALADFEETPERVVVEDGTGSSGRVAA
jgi:hypothetical protein